MLQKKNWHIFVSVVEWQPKSMWLNSWEIEGILVSFVSCYYLFTGILVFYQEVSEYYFFFIHHLLVLTHFLVKFNDFFVFMVEKFFLQLNHFICICICIWAEQISAGTWKLNHSWKNFCWSWMSNNNLIFFLFSANTGTLSPICAILWSTTLHCCNF